MPFKNLSIRIVAKTLFALPFVAFSMNLVAEPITSMEGDGNKAVLCVEYHKDLEKALNDDSCRVLFIRNDENNIPLLCVKEPNGAVRSATDEDYVNCSCNTIRAISENLHVDRDVKIVSDVMPEFLGSDSTMQNFINNNIAYPKDAWEKSIGGKCYVSFVVNSDGVVDDINLTRSSGNVSLDNEALRIISVMPKWKPGTIDGEPVNVSFVVPIKFNFISEFVAPHSILDNENKLTYVDNREDFEKAMNDTISRVLFIKEVYNVPYLFLKEANGAKRRVRENDYDNWPVESITAFSELSQTNGEVVYVASDERLNYNYNCDMSLRMYVAEHIVYPIKARERGIQGRSYVSFIINTKGNIVDLQLVKSTGALLLDIEVLKVISKMHKCEPATINGVPVNTYVTIPINFGL